MRHPKQTRPGGWASPDKMKPLIFCLIALALLARAEPLKPAFDREWSFPGGGGSIVIGLTRISRTDPRLFSLTIINNNLQPDISREAKCLKSTLEDLRREGNSPEKLWSIYSEFGGDNARALALAADKSKEWSKATATHYAQAVVHLLNAIDAYEPYGRVLRQYGLSVQVDAAEYISLSSPETFGLQSRSTKPLPAGASVRLATKPAAISP